MLKKKIIPIIEKLESFVLRKEIIMNENTNKYEGYVYDITAGVAVIHYDRVPECLQEEVDPKNPIYKIELRDYRDLGEFWSHIRMMNIAPDWGTYYEEVKRVRGL